MFKQKPQEDRDSPKAAAGGKGSLLRRRWKLLAVGGCVLVAAGVLLVGLEVLLVRSWSKRRAKETARK